MAKLTIIGNPNPVIGEKEVYTISTIDDHFQFIPTQPPLQQIPIHWRIFVEDRKGWRRTTDNKEGQVVPYTFGQKSLHFKAIKIFAQQGNESGELLIHPQRGKEPKITRVELLDANYAPLPKGKMVSYKDTIIARAYCVEMYKKSISFTFWEDDTKGEVHDPIINMMNKINTVPIMGVVDEYGKADVTFRLPMYTMAVQIANAHVASGEKDEGRAHEYYVTAEFVVKHIVQASPNVNVINPTHIPPTPASKTSSKTPEANPIKPKPTADTPKFPITSNGKKQADPDAKILNAEFLNERAQPIEKAEVGDTVIIKITTQHMKGRNVTVRIWEEETGYKTHHKIYEKKWVLPGNENFIKVPITKKIYELGITSEDMRNEKYDYKFQVYFIEVEPDNTHVTSQVIPITKSAKKLEVENSRSVAIIKKPREKRKEKTNDTCGIEYRDKISCTKYGNTYGPVFWGDLKLANYNEWNLLLSKNKITLEEKEIIIGMSENEGKLDSVQSYDSEIVTVGAMQKTVNSQGYGEFPIQMHEFKEEYPDKFKSLFQNCGWDVKKEVIKNGNKEIIKWKAYYQDITGKELKDKIRAGFNAKNYKKKVQCIPVEPLVSAARDPYFQAKQIEDFIKRLHVALNETVVKTFHLNTKKVKIADTNFAFKAKDILKSKLGKATLLDQSVNRPALTKFDLGSAINRFFEKNPKVSQSPNDWGLKHAEYEKQILDDYGMHRNGTDMLGRYNRMKNNSHLK